MQFVLALIRIPHHTAQHIRLFVHGKAFLESYRCPGRWEVLQSIDIYLVFEIQAALQLAALTGKLLWVWKNLLCLCDTCRDRLEVRQPSAAAQLASASAYSAHLAGFLAHTYLLHLDTYVELLGEHLYKVSEVDTVVSGIVEYGLRVVALVFHVVHFHHQSEFLCDMAGLLQRRLFLLDGGRPALYVARFRTAEQFLDVLRRRIHLLLYHLDAADLASQTNDAYVMSWYSLHGHNIAIAHVDAIGNPEEILTVVFEAHLYAVERLLHRFTYPFHPVARTNLAAASEFCFSDRHIRLRTVVASARQIERLFVFHLRHRRVGLQVWVHSTLVCKRVDGDLLRVSVLVFARMAYRAFLFTASDKRLHLFRGGGIFVGFYDTYFLSVFLKDLFATIGRVRLGSPFVLFVHVRLPTLSAFFRVGPGTTRPPCSPLSIISVVYILVFVHISIGVLV